jgi:hypothetical protein
MEQDPVIAAENARLAFEQTLLLWEDEVAYAETLRDKRKTYSTGLVILAGLGIFRLAWTRKPDEVPAIDSDATRLILKCVLTFALGCFLLSAYFLFSERPVVSKVACGACPPIGRGIGRRKRALGFKDVIAVPELAQSFPKHHGAARRELELSRQALALIQSASTVEVWSYRQRQLRKAYDWLALANSRVNHRMGMGVLSMLAGYFVLAIVFVVYFRVVRKG